MQSIGKCSTLHLIAITNESSCKNDFAVPVRFTVSNIMSYRLLINKLADYLNVKLLVLDEIFAFNTVRIQIQSN